MNFDQAIYGAMITFPGLEGATIRPDIALDTDIAPYIVYSMVFNAANWTLTGPSTLDNAHFQVDVYSKVRADGVALADLVTQAITQSATLTGIPISNQSGYEPDTKLYRRMMVFSVWLNA